MTEPLNNTEHPLQSPPVYGPWAQDWTAEALREVETGLIAKNPPAFAPIIRRHGPALYHYCWITGGMGGCLGEAKQIYLEAFTTIANAPSKRGVAQALDKRAARAVTTLTNLCNQLASMAAEARGFPPEAIRECQQDIQRASALTFQDQGKGPNGLIVPH